MNFASKITKKIGQEEANQLYWKLIGEIFNFCVLSHRTIKPFFMNGRIFNLNPINCYDFGLFAERLIV